MIYNGFLLFLLLEYVRPANYLPALLVLHLNSIVPVLTFAGAVLTKGQDTLRKMASDINGRVIATIIVLTLFSVMTADVTEYSWTAFTTVAGYGMAFWIMMSELTSVARIKGVAAMLIVVHLIVAALNPILFTDPDNRHYISSGFFLGDGNDFALSLNVVVPLCLFLLQDSKRVAGRILWGFALLVLVAGVVLTKSRGGTLALVSMAACYWATSNKKVQTAFVGVAIVTLIATLAPPSYFDRMRTIGDTGEGSNAGRLSAWTASIRMAADNPILGVGAGHFGVKYGNEYRPPDALGSGMTAHSLYFLALGELGLPGLAVVLVFFWSNLQGHRRLSAALGSAGGRESDQRLLMAVTTSIVAFAVGGAFLSCLYYPHLYILGALSAATVRVLSIRQHQTVAAAPQHRAIHTHWSLKRPADAGRAIARRNTR